MSRSQAFELSDNFGNAPALLRWDIVSRCNLSCSHCCVGGMLRDDETEDLSPEDMRQGLTNMASAGVQAIHFLGGEPTLRKDFLDILHHTAELGMEPSFNTNGIRSDDKYLDAIFSSNTGSVTISFDGPDAASHDALRGIGSFNRSLHFVKRLAAERTARDSQRPEIQVQAVLTRHWVDRVDKMLAFAQDVGADSLVINHLASMGDAIDNKDDLSVTPAQQFQASMTLLEAMRHYPDIKVSAPVRLKVMQYYRMKTGDRAAPLKSNSCPAVDRNAHVQYDGTVTPCQLAHSQGLGAADLPNVLDDAETPEDIFASAPFEDFSSSVKKSRAEVYANQIPCNRCMFLGNGCLPCPLPTTPGEYTTNYQCLIAERLIAAVKTDGGVAPTPEDEAEVAAQVVVDNPVRYETALAPGE